jgi:hypothetical protein
MKRPFILAALACAAVALAIPPAAAADDTMCSGPLTGTFDNVVVPEGDFCRLTDSLVRGNVKALRDSQLIMGNDEVDGNVEGDKASAVIVDASTVRGSIHIIEAHDPFFLSAAVFNSSLPNGNIQIEKGTGEVDGFALGDWNVRGNTLGKGNIKVEQNNAFFFSSITRNTVGGNVQVFKNTGPAFKIVTDNVIRENLQCKENEEPFVGQPNAVGGNAEDQCAGTGSSTRTLAAGAASHAEAVALRDYSK